MQSIINLGRFPDLFRVGYHDLTRAFSTALKLNGVDLSMRNGAYHKRMVDYSFDGVDQWHHDCGQRSTWNFVWADRVPTEIMQPDGSVFQGKPSELIAFNNRAVKHRHPSMARCQLARRNFVVVRTTVEPLTGLHLDTLKAALS